MLDGRRSGHVVAMLNMLPSDRLCNWWFNHYADAVENGSYSEIIQAIVARLSLREIQRQERLSSYRWADAREDFLTPLAFAIQYPNDKTPALTHIVRDRVCYLSLLTKSNIPAIYDELRISGVPDSLLPATPYITQLILQRNNHRHRLIHNGLFMGMLPLEVVDSVMEFLPPEDLVAHSFFMPPSPLTVQFQNLPEHT